MSGQNLAVSSGVNCYLKIPQNYKREDLLPLDDSLRGQCNVM